MSGHTTIETDLDTVDGPMHAFVSTPDGAPRGGVVVVQEAFGLTGHIRRVCESLADAGYIAVAPALFHRCEDQVFGYGEYDRLRPVIMTITRESIETDVDAAFAQALAAAMIASSALVGGLGAHLIERGLRRSGALPPVAA